MNQSLILCCSLASHSDYQHQKSNCANPPQEANYEINMESKEMSRNSTLATYDRTHGHHFQILPVVSSDDACQRCFPPESYVAGGAIVRCEGKQRQSLLPAATTLHAPQRDTTRLCRIGSWLILTDIDYASGIAEIT